MFLNLQYIETLKKLVLYIEKNKSAESRWKAIIEIKKCFSRLRRGILKPSQKKDIIMDNESYFTLRHSGVSCNVGYYKDEKINSWKCQLFW